MYRLKLLLNPLGTILLLMLYFINKNNEDLKMDLLKYETDFTLSKVLKSFIWYKEFRNVFYYRARKKSKFSSVLSKICSVFYKPEETLMIFCENIKGGLFIQHGIATIITASSIGENCQINQQVSIGYNTKSLKPPTIGDNVSIYAGAKVFGDIKIGNNVKIGANAVVLTDVPDNCIAVGVPAVIKKIK
jgi:serine O-acetyltransferase